MGALAASLVKLAGRRDIRATLTTTGTNLLVLTLNLGTGLLTARYLGPEGRGELAAMVLWPQFLSSLLTLGLPHATTYNLVRHREDQAALASVGLLLSLVLGLVTTVVGVAIIPVWTAHYDDAVIRFARWTMLFAPMIMFMWSVNACLQAHGHFDLLNRNLYLQPALTLAALLVLAVTDRFTPFTAALATMLGPLPVFVANLVWLWREQRPRLVEPLRHAAELLRYGLRSYGIGLLGALSQQFDRVFVLGALSPAAMGLYMVARSAAQPTRLFSSALNTVLFPKASSLPSVDAVALAALGARVNIVVVALIALPLALAGPTLIGLLYGRDFVDAALPFQLLVGEGAIAAITSTLAQAFMSVGRPGVVTILQLTGFALCAALLTLLTPLYGIVGAAAALLAGAILRWVVTLACFPFVLGTRVPRLWLNVDDLRVLLRARRPVPS
jgi:O-antigen/teichoic acid export membrane protein